VEIREGEHRMERLWETVWEWSKFCHKMTHCGGNIGGG
jgi:hypothetical protein